jgi:YgiT-type zinc finger domain-containing protein
VDRFQSKEADVKCEVCGTGERREQLIRYSLSIGEKLVVVEHVPASVCDRCGETTLAPEVVERLQNTISTSRTPVRVLETPVYEFA